MVSKIKDVVDMKNYKLVTREDILEISMILNTFIDSTDYTYKFEILLEADSLFDKRVLYLLEAFQNRKNNNSLNALKWYFFCMSLKSKNIQSDDLIMI